jgi:hypothetical protein
MLNTMKLQDPILVRISEVGVLEISQIHQGLVRILIHWPLSISKPVATDEKESQADREKHLSGSTADNQFAPSLIDRGFRPEERVRPDDVAHAVRKEDESRGRGSFGIAGNVGSGHLQGHDEGADEGSTL